MTRKFVLRFHMAPGDVSLMTALLRDLKLRHPEFQVGVHTNFEALFKHNPRVSQLDRNARDVVTVPLDDKQKMRPWLTDTGRIRRHYLTWCYDEFKRRTGIAVPLTAPRPEFFFSPDELRPLVSGRYWIIVPGGKSDMTNKIWTTSRYQEVVDRLRPHGLRFVQEGAARAECLHPPLRNVLNLVGQTSIRDLLVNILHAEGVICGVTFPMHAAAGLNRPCVVLGGGRESPWAEAYVDSFGAFPTQIPVAMPHRYLHALGLLACCAARGCLKQRVVRLADHRQADNSSLCERPVISDHAQIVPKCLDLIEVDHVLEAVMSYYEEGLLDPIGAPKRTVIPPAAPVAAPEPRLERPTSQQESGAARPTKALTMRLPKEMAPGGPLLPTVAPPPAAPPPTAVRVLPVPAAADGPAAPAAAPRDRPTICVLLHGSGHYAPGARYHDLHARCLNSLLPTIRAEGLELRVGANQIDSATEAYLAKVPEAIVYADRASRRKYGAMRAMFRDPERPLTTAWVAWFDDDSYIRAPDWLQRWRALLAGAGSARVGLYGQIMYHELRAQANAVGVKPRDWFATAPWWRNRDLCDRRGQVSASGRFLRFVTGGFWLASVEALRAAGAPDDRINHNGGDICIGAQIWQAGYEIREFNSGKALVHTSAAPRRGYQEKFPWR